MNTRDLNIIVWCVLFAVLLCGCAGGNDTSGTAAPQAEAVVWCTVPILIEDGDYSIDVPGVGQDLYQMATGRQLPLVRECAL